MKIKNVFQIMGIRGKSKHYGYNLKKFEVGTGTDLTCARWLHPGESEKEISLEVVETYREILKDGDFLLT